MDARARSEISDVVSELEGINGVAATKLRYVVTQHRKFLESLSSKIISKNYLISSSFQVK